MTAVQIALADELLSQGLAFWAAFQAKKVAGTLTNTDLDAAGSKLDVDFAQFVADVAAQHAAKT